MKVLVLVSALLAISLADNCDNSFGPFLNSLKDEIVKRGSDLETEYRDDYLKLVRQCFANSNSDGSKCLLTDADLTVDVYSDNGLLHGCSTCQSFFKALRDKYMKSQESVRKCFRNKFDLAIQQEFEPCIQGKITNGSTFKAPLITDLDEKAFNYINIIEQGINYRIAAGNKLDACQSLTPSKYQGTVTCMVNEFPGIYSKNCAVVKAAKSATVSSSCSGRFEEARKATCQCMDEKRADWHARFTKIQDIVNSAKSASDCGQKISDVMGAWLTKLQDAFDNCLPQESSWRTMIELGCGQVINQSIKQSELITRFRFIRLILDALTDRLTINCDKNCS